MVLGRVVKVHGLQGAVRIESYAASADSFAGPQNLQVKSRDGQVRRAKVEWLRPHPKGWRLKFHGVDDPEAAQGLVGAEVGLSRSELPEPAEGEYYWVDLIGLEARARDGRPVGRVKGLFATAAHDVLAVEGPAGEEILIPMVAAALDRVDLEAGVIILADVEGLLPGSAPD